jgi:hypothetical protein
MVRSSTALARFVADDVSLLRSSSSTFSANAPNLESTTAALGATCLITQRQPSTTGSAIPATLTVSVAARRGF